jgi:hypothetical protein
VSPPPHPIGPDEVYSPDEAAAWLGISRERVSVLIRDRVLIETTTPDGRWGLSGYSLLSERDGRATAPWWHRAARRLWHDLPW